MAHNTETNRNDRALTHTREDPALFKGAAALIRSDCAISRDDLYRRLRDNWGILDYTKAKFSRRITDLGYKIYSRRNTYTGKSERVFIRPTSALVWVPNAHGAAVPRSLVEPEPEPEHQEPSTEDEAPSPEPEKNWQQLRDEMNDDYRQWRDSQPPTWADPNAMRAIGIDEEHVQEEIRRQQCHSSS